MKGTMKQIRQFNEKKQSDVAKELGVSESTYNAYENFKKTPKLDVAIKFSKMFNVKLDDIIFFK